MKFNSKKVYFIIWLLILIISSTYSIILPFAIFFLSMSLFKNITFLIKANKLRKEYAIKLSDLKYFRDIPDEKNATPARAIYLYNFKYNDSNLYGYISKIISASILDFSLKGMVKFDKIDDNEVKISLIDNDKVELTKDEQIIYEIIQEYYENKGNFIKRNEIIDVLELFLSNENRIYERDSKVDKKIEDLLTTLKQYCEENEIIDKNKNDAFVNLKERYDELTLLFWGLLFILLIILLTSPFITIMTAACFVFPCTFILDVFFNIIVSSNIKKIPTLSEQGYRLTQEWKALKEFICDYSYLNEKEIRDKILWEKYLVYATAFGVSKETFRQLLKLDFWNIFDSI